MSQIGQEQTPDDQEDGPPELLFIHGGESIEFTNAFSSLSSSFLGHTARPTDFCWAPGEGENWTASSVSEDNVVMVWQPTQRVWAGDDLIIEEHELESNAMQGVQSTHGSSAPSGKKSTSGSGSGGGSARSQSMSISATASVSGIEADDEDA